MDLGAKINLLPLPVLKRIGDLDVRPTIMTMQLADRYIKLSHCVFEDVLVKVDMRDGAECFMLFAILSVETKRAIIGIGIVSERRWMKFLKDFDFQLIYHPGKASVVADALIRKSIHMSAMMIRELELIEQLRDLRLEVEVVQDHISCGMITITNEFLRQKGTKQLQDPELLRILGLLHGVSSSIIFNRDPRFISRRLLKSYVDRRRKPLEFEEGEHVFHVSQLRNYIRDPSHVLEMDEVQVRENLTYEKRPVAVVDHKLKEFRGKSISLVKILWDAATGEATWEVESQFKERYLFLFSGKPIFGDKNSCLLGGIVT
uniref:Uncharacterized protein n=1 Tax=Cajanus cajan TaxID=3821 RepID=A0A151SW97_CAJCA|nr:hypothetical protein KK1_014499 [Cajanus cajan]